MTDDEAMRYTLLMRAFEMSDNASEAITLAENMRRFVCGLGHETPAQPDNLTQSIKSVLRDFEGPVQGFNSVAIPGKVDDDYEIGEGGRRRSMTETLERYKLEIVNNHGDRYIRCDPAPDGSWVMFKDVAALQARVAELEGALDFYACVDHYQIHNAAAPNVVQFDRGAKARAALEGGKE